MDQDTKEKSDKEYVKIPKEDFEKIYSTIDMIEDTLLIRENELREAYDTLVKLKSISERVIKKSIIVELNEAKYKIDYVRSSLIAIYSHLSELKGEILDEIKKEQIDKNQKDSKDIKEEDED